MSLLRPSADQFVRFPLDERPRLLVSIDAEEEFDWSKLATRKRHTVESMKFRWRSHTIFDRYGICPTYMLDYPVAEDQRIAESLAELSEQGRCCIGAHLHPWTNPPHEEELSTYNSFPGNLARDLERRKLQALSELIEQKIKQRPVIYRAGRYGVGEATESILEELGFKIDMSVIPLRDYSAQGGPDFSRSPAWPYWFGSKADLLEIPLSAGHTGTLRFLGKLGVAASNLTFMKRIHLPGLLARSGLLKRIYITPEGMPLEEAKRLTRALLEDGHRIFTVHFHSPSLDPGNTPYVSSRADLERFLSWLEIYFDFFMSELGGIAVTPLRIYEEAKALRAPLPSSGAARTREPVVSRFPATSASAHDISIVSREPPQKPKCLIIATNFPPIRGGSAVVYENLCKFGLNSIIALTAWRSYTTGEEIAGWRQRDQTAPFWTYRIELLRPSLSVRHGLASRAISFLLQDLPLMFRVFWKTRSIVRKYRIKIICIGELVYGGWLVLACRYLLGCKVVTYIHGEEITVTGNSRSERMKRAYLEFSDMVIAVSRFTRDILVKQMKVEPNKIILIENGVDLNRFREKPRSAELLERHGLEGKHILLSVGRLVERKGYDKMLMALPQILERHRDVHYVVVGEGPFRAELERIAAREGVINHITFVGQVSDEELADYYSLGDIFVLPNREMPDGDTEGFGLVYLEANACGKPVISGRAGGVLDAVQDGINGLTVDGNDPSSIAAAILRLLEDRDLYARLRSGGLLAAQQSSWLKRAEQFNLLCNRLGAT